MSNIVNAAPMPNTRNFRAIKSVSTRSLTCKITSGPPIEEPMAAGPATLPIRTTKRAIVIALLERDTGASLADLTGATGWLPHTVRASLTGLRKRGLIVTRSKVEAETRYAVTATAA